MDYPLEQRYTDYKTLIAKVPTIEQAQAETKRAIRDLADAWKLEILLEFHYLQHVMVQPKQDFDMTSRRIRHASTRLGEPEFIQQHGQELAAVLAWFDALESQDPVRQGDLKNVLEGTIHLTTRREFVKCMARDPWMRIRITDGLLRCSTLSSRYHIPLCDMLTTLVELDPSSANLIRHKLYGMRVLPSFITRLTVTHCADAVYFLNGVFCQSPAWFLAQSAGSAGDFKQIKQTLLQTIQGCLDDVDTHQVELCLHLRVLAGLVGYLGIKLHPNELHYCSVVLQASRVERLVQLALTLLILCADQAVLMRDLGTTLMTASHVTALPMLWMAYFQTDQFAKIEETVRTILNMQVAIPKMGLFEMQKLFRMIQTESNPQKT